MSSSDMLLKVLRTTDGRVSEEASLRVILTKLLSLLARLDTSKRRRATCGGQIGRVAFGS